jgi:putative ABC transport system permease protein
VALQLLATLVAFIGILSTLMSLQLERTPRDRRAARHRHDAAPTVAALAAGDGVDRRRAPACWPCPPAAAGRLILIYIINLRSFGWTLEMQLDPMDLSCRPFLVALVAALLAGLYPAWKIGNTPPAIAVRSE